MSSGFVSGGTVEKPTERDAEWLKAQQDIEARRREREEAGRQEGGKSLYEVLQSNKAAKEEAFQESIKLKNQFRNLDEDEVEFLDSVLESTRAKEQAVKEETKEQLEVFRRQQEEADKKALAGGGMDEETAASPTAETNDTQWVINARKRKRLKGEKASKGAKLRKFSSTAEASPQTPLESQLHVPSTETADRETGDRKGPVKVDNGTTSKTSPASVPQSSNSIPEAAQPSNTTAESRPRGTPGLGLGDYSSDEG